MITLILDAIFRPGGKRKQLKDMTMTEAAEAMENGTLTFREADQLVSFYQRLIVVDRYGNGK